MFCRNCGTENTNEAKFCKTCGKPLQYGTGAEALSPGTQGGGAQESRAQTDTAQHGGAAGELPNGSGGKASPGSHKSLAKKRLLVAAAAAISLLVIIWLLTGLLISFGRKINLNDYLLLKTSGYDGYGKASVELDWKAIEKKYGKKLAFTGDARREFEETLGLMTPLDALREAVRLEADKTSGLKNGDVLSYHWDVDDNIEDTINYKLKFKDDEFTVSDLKQAESFDAFAGVSLEFSGVQPDGSLEIEYTGPELDASAFLSDKQRGLSNGDTIKLSIDQSIISRLVEQSGKLPAEMEKTYTVSGLESYIGKLDEIDDAARKVMQQQASDVYQARVAKHWGEGEKLERFDYIGDYMLFAKQQDRSAKNFLFMVYKAQVRNTYANNGAAYDKLNDVYWYIRFDNIMTDSEGKTKVDVTRYSEPDEKVSIDSGVSSGWFGTKSWYYPGYQSLDSLYKSVVTANLDAFRHEDRGDENLAETAAQGTGGAQTEAQTGAQPEAQGIASGETQTGDQAETQAGLQTASTATLTASAVSGEGYVLAKSATELLSRADLEQLTAQDCRIARNEIYARHGRKFSDKQLQAYFDACSWYHGSVEPGNFQESVLSETEKANMRLIVDYEKEKGYKS